MVAVRTPLQALFQKKHQGFLGISRRSETFKNSVPTQWKRRFFDRARMKKIQLKVKVLIIIIIIIISIFKEDNVLSITASLPCGPPVNTDIDYYRTFFRTCFFLQVLRG